MRSRVEKGEVTTIVRRESSSALDPAALRRAFGAFPSGVVAVAAEVDGVPVGMVASSFTSVSLEPALVSFSIANTSSTWPLLRRSARLGLSVLADHHDHVCRQLAGPAAQRFDGL
jgi:flavin reductase (DIM6/NTAB) family NADH-FMN oxidoreductase RutF